MAEMKSVLQHTNDNLFKKTLAVMRAAKKRVIGIMLVIGLAIFAWLIYKTGPSNIISAIMHLNVFYILIAIVIRWFASFITAVRLKNLMRTSLSTFTIFKISLISLIVNLGSIVQGGGTIIKAGLLKKEKVGFARSGAAISSEIGYNMLTAGTIFLIFILYKFKSFAGTIFKNSNLDLLIIIPIVTIIVLTLVIIFRRNSHIQRYIRNVMINFSFFNFISNLFLSILIWCLAGLTMFFVFKSMGYTLALPILIFGATASYLSASISFVPTGIGVREATRAYIYTLSGLSLSVTGTASILARMIMFPSLILLAFILQLFEKKRWIFRKL